MDAVQTQPDAPPLLIQVILIRHARSIASTNTPAHLLANHGDGNEESERERWRKTIRGARARRRFGSVRRSAELRDDARRDARCPAVTGLHRPKQSGQRRFLLPGGELRRQLVPLHLV
jgi:hypothetical protein